MDERRCRSELTQLGAPDAAPVVESLYDPVATATGGVWRFRVGGDWSAVLKVLRPGVAGGHPLWSAGLDERHWYYWKREALALEASLVPDGVGLRPPVVLGVFERADGTVAIWLEDLALAVPGGTWPLVRYESAARAVGRWQGATVATGTVPQDACLSRDWLRAYVRRREPAMGRIGDARHLGADCATAAALLWTNRERLLAFLDSLPRTVCHFDLHPDNLFDAEEVFVLIDWAFVGIGAVGEDPATLIPDAVLDFHVIPDRLDDLAGVVVDGYAAGLRDAGVHVDWSTIALWIDVAMLARYTWIFGAIEDQLAGDAPRLNRRATEEALPYWLGAARWLAKRSSATLSAVSSALR